MENTNEGRTWNYKRIFVAIFLIIALVLGGYYINAHVLGNKINFFDKGPKPKSIPKGSVKGIATIEEETDIQKKVKEKIDEIKKNVTNLDVLDIASSSPPVQKILNDIKALKEYPENELKSICKQICGL